MVKALMNFLKLEAASSILLLLGAILALVVNNTSLSWLYEEFLYTDFRIQLGALDLHKPLLLWINDGLMALFFLLVGLELKREILTGELSDFRKVLLPICGAVGGMAVPALVYLAINADDPVVLRGWAIPSATDIAFALGVLSLFGTRCPSSLKVFLLTLAIIDDLGAIIIIALFYSADIHVAALWVAGAMMLVLWVMNWWRVTSIAMYLLIGTVLWVAVLKSGIHATLAGVLLAFFIPIGVKGEGDTESPLERLEHDLHPAVAYFILPIFAFANAGIPLAGMSLSTILNSTTLGISCGLFFGKQIGIMLFCGVARVLRLGNLPSGASWMQLYGVSALCGIGFTMSLFIGSLAFKEVTGDFSTTVRLGIILGSLCSALFGAVVLHFSLPKNQPAQLDQ